MSSLYSYVNLFLCIYFRRIAAGIIKKGIGDYERANKRRNHEQLSFERLDSEESLQRSRAFLAQMRKRRSIRAFSPEPVPFELIENAIARAATAPSGANQQPWRFVVVGDTDLKRRIREIVEQEERESYEHRFPAEWLAALAPLGMDWHKEFIEIAPSLQFVFSWWHQFMFDSEVIVPFCSYCLLIPYCENVRLYCSAFVSSMQLFAVGVNPLLTYACISRTPRSIVKKNSHEGDKFFLNFANVPIFHWQFAIAMWYVISKYCVSTLESWQWNSSVKGSSL